MSEGKEWVRACALAEVPSADKVIRVQAAGRDLCLANVAGTLHVLDDVCPHRQGPLHEGWIEEGQVVCPWHGWAFDPGTGVCTNAQGRVEVFTVKVEGPDVLIQISEQL